MKIVKSWVSADGLRRVEIVARDSGLFAFSEEVLTFEDLSDIGQESFTYWKPAFESGYYQALADAERDALAMTPWLRKFQTEGPQGPHQLIS